LDKEIHDQLVATIGKSRTGPLGGEVLSIECGAKNMIRYQYRFSDAPEKLLDFSLHVIASMLVCFACLHWVPVWAFVLQWLPDLMVIILLIRMLVTWTYIPSVSHHPWLYTIHKILHNSRLAFAVVVIGAIFYYILDIKLPILLLLPLQWGTHRIVDHFTHRKGWLS
jgi:hypothetical protein